MRHTTRQTCTRTPGAGGVVAKTGINNPGRVAKSGSDYPFVAKP